MNKKVNTALFILGASVLNIILMIGVFILLLAILGALLPEDTSATAGQFILLFAFLASIAASFGIYTLVIRLISNRIDMEKYFHPIFKPRRRK